MFVHKIIKLEFIEPNIYDNKTEFCPDYNDSFV